MCMRLRSHLGAQGRLTVREWAVPPGGQIWTPSPRNGPLIQQLLAAGHTLVDEDRIKNEVLNSGRDLLRDFLAGTAGLSGLSYYAVGTDATAPTKTQTPQRLIAEVWRGVFAADPILDVAKITVEAYLPALAANGVTLVEAGPFGNGATAAANSGTCYARATHNPRVKNEQKAFTYSHDLTF